MEAHTEPLDQRHVITQLSRAPDKIFFLKKSEPYLGVVIMLARQRIIIKEENNQTLRLETGTRMGDILINFIKYGSTMSQALWRSR